MRSRDVLLGGFRAGSSSSGGIYETFKRDPNYLSVRREWSGLVVLFSFSLNLFPPHIHSSFLSPFLFLIYFFLFLSVWLCLLPSLSTVSNPYEVQSNLLVFNLIQLNSIQL